MSVADLAAVDAALVAVLSADATLQGLCPDGVYRDTAPAGSSRYVIVSLITHVTEEGFGAALYERFVYAVKAVLPATTGVDANAAALRIHGLLYRTILAPIAGYTHMATLRLEPIRYMDGDAIDDDLRYQHAGAQYEISVSPNP